MNPKQIVAHNLQRLLDKKGVTQTQMANHLNYPEMTVSNWMKAKTYPRVDKMQEMADYFGVKRSDIEELKNNNSIETSSQYIHLPTTISAGLPINVDAITESDMISIPDSILGKHAGNKDIMIMSVSGDSMDKVIPDGSLIAVKPVEKTALKNGDIVVFSDEHEYSVKRFYKTDNELIFKPESHNFAHMERRCSFDDNISINGRVVVYIVELD